MRLSSTLSNTSLKTSSNGDTTMSLGRLFQWEVILTIKKFFPMSRWNLSRCNLHPLPLVYHHAVPCGQTPHLSKKKLWKHTCIAELVFTLKGNSWIHGHNTPKAQLRRHCFQRGYRPRLPSPGLSEQLSLRNSSCNTSWGEGECRCYKANKK